MKRRAFRNPPPEIPHPVPVAAQSPRARRQAGRCAPIARMVGQLARSRLGTNYLRTICDCPPPLAQIVLHASSGRVRRRLRRGAGTENEATFWGRQGVRTGKSVLTRHWLGDGRRRSAGPTERGNRANNAAERRDESKRVHTSPSANREASRERFPARLFRLDVAKLYTCSILLHFRSAIPPTMRALAERRLWHFLFISCRIQYHGGVWRRISRGNRDRKNAPYRINRVSTLRRFLRSLK